ncbi:MAG: 4Fe-4S ferredoxin [Firmicutes bacterium HGW-Firmicutes-16]|nr:MAG: 4Fe-4S ferredoxin [Firmicutes bacterium HGW-Firmicutes-16]
MRQKIRKGILTFSALLFPLLFFFLSPYIIIASASVGILNGSSVVFGFLLLTSIVGSRLFCGWLCPGGAIQDFVSTSNDKRWNGKWKNAFKHIIWVVWFSFIVYLWVRHWPLKTDFFYMVGIDLPMVIMYFFVMTLIYVLSLVTGKRGMCHSLCWMAPFMVIGEKLADLLHIPRFRLKADSAACVSCGKCSKNCPMSLNVAEMVKAGNLNSTECISCLECVDGCPKKAISCGISR